MLGNGKVWLSIILVNVLLLSSFGALTTPRHAIGEDTPQVGVGRLVDTNIDGDDSLGDLWTGSSLAKVPLSLQKRIYDERPVKVIVATKDIGELGRFFRDRNVYDYKGTIGEGSGRGLAYPILEVPPNIIPMIASLEGVLGVYEYSEPEISMSAAEDEMMDETFGIPYDVQQAWANGFTGEGVNVAILDTGIDFAHPDLNGAVARVDDSSSPYDGWPIAFDPDSMKAYMDSDGEATGWYVNTSYNGTGPFEAIHTIALDGENDFGETEKAEPSDGVDISETDYELTSYYVTRDLANWYMGFNTLANNTTMSYGIYIDVDGTVSGSDEDPRGNYIDTKATHSDAVTAVAFSPDGTMIASASKDNIIKIWDAAGNLIKELRGHVNAIHSIAWTPNSTWLASASGTQIKIWNVTSGEEITGEDTFLIFPDYELDALPESSGRNMMLSFNNDGTHVATGGVSNYIRVFNTTYNGTPNLDKAPAYEIQVSGTYAYSVAFNPNGTRLTAGFTDDKVRIFDTTAPYSPVSTFPCGSDVYSVAWNSDGTRLVAGLMDKKIQIWDTENELLEGNITTTGYVTKAAWSPDDSKIVSLVSNLTDNKIEIWDVSGAPSSWHWLATLENNRKRVNSIDWSGSKVVSCGDDTKVKTWDVSPVDPADWKEIKTFQWHLPDYVLYLDHTGIEWGKDSDGVVQTHNDSVMTSMLYRWNGAAWDKVSGAYNITLGINPSNSILYTNGTLFYQNQYYSIIGDSIYYGGVYSKLTIVGGDVAYSGYDGNRFLELSIPRELIGDPSAISVELFTVGKEKSHAQDTVPSDVNVAFSTPDWGVNYTSLSNFATFAPMYYTVDDTEIDSISGRYCYGTHPDDYLSSRYGSVGILVADSSASGVYNKVYIDSNHDYVFDSSDVVLAKGSEVTDFPDVFAPAFVNPSGLLYFIADGTTPIPYSEIYAERYGILDKKNSSSWEVFNETLVPRNGELLCFMGEFNRYVSTLTNHGTKSASAILSVAPNASFIPIGDLTKGSYFDALYFAAEGYDGKVNSGDEAQIGCIGLRFPTEYGTGWDVYSRFTDYISKVYANDSTVFVSGAGDSGYGYGTISSPASAPGVIAVGTASGGTNVISADVHPSSARGPTALGQPKPDVVSVGAVKVALPLWESGDTTTTSLWQGSDAASAVTTGVLALVFDAYDQARHSYPNGSLARAILMSGADDMNHDILGQGAGLVNASRATDIANGRNGLLVAPTSWVPGDFEGSKYEAFTRLMYPGKNDATTYTVDNMNSTTLANARISDMAFEKTGEYTYAETTQDSGDSIWLMLNHTGIYNIVGDALEKIDEIDTIMWHTSTLVKVTAHASWIEMFNEDEEELYEYELDVFNWTSIKSPPTHDDNLYTMSTCQNNANILEARVHDPARRIDNGLMIKMGPRPGASGEAGILWTMVVEFYNRTNWNWLTTTETSLSIGGGDTASFNATMNVPDDAGVGSYEGGIYVDYDGRDVAGESVAEYPTYPVPDEEIANVTIYDGTDESVSNSTPRIANLAHGNITGNMNLSKIGVFANDTVVYYPNGTETVPWGFYLNGNITNYTFLEVFIPGDGKFNATDGGPFTVDNTTGYVEFTDAFWNDPLNNNGITEFYAWFEYTPASSTLQSPSNYTLYPINGTIILNVTDALQPGEYLVTNYSWYEPIITTQLSHGNISACTLYPNGTTELVGGGVDYTLNSITGEITFTPALGPGDVVNASYDWYVPELIMSALLGHSSIVPSSWVVYRSTGGGPPVPMAAGEYTIDTQSGAVIFSSALDPGDTITADYTYYNHTTTLPVLVNVATNRVKLELGSPNTFDITNELVTDVPTYSITDETVATVLPYQRVNEFVTSVPTSMVTNEPVIGNAPVVVTNEFVLYSLGGDTEAYLDHGSIESGNVDKIIAGTYTLYNNDIPMTETVDYTLSVFTGKITFTPPLPADCIITADYSYCKKAITEAYLDHCSATQERIVSASYTIYDGGIPMTDSVQYTLDLATGEITFKGAYTPLPLGAVITASYSYYLKITTVYLDYPGLMADEIDVVKKSYTIYNNSVKLIENTDYKLYPTTGKIDFLNTYKPLPVSAKITATYSYYYLVNNAPLDHGPSPDEAVVGGSSDLWRFTSFNNKSFVYITTGKEGSVPWGFDLPNGNITNYTHLCIIKKAVFYTLELGINFTVDAITGHVQMISADFANPTSGWSFYAWYRYVEPLSEPYDYTIDSDSGMISFNVLLNANDVVMANYSYYNPGMYHLTYFASTDPSYGFTYAQLKYRNVVSGSYDIGKNGELLTEHTDYEIDMVTGIISFMIPLAPTDAIFANYTYTDASRGLFNNNGMFGGHSTESRSGDWRYYYVNIPDQGLFKNNEKNLYLYLNVSWELDVSDIDIMVYGKTTQTENPITEDSLPAERYGAYTLGSITKSDGSIYTTTGTSQEFLATPLVTGLNLIALRNTIINGTESHEQFGGEIGWLRLSSTSVSVTTNELSGEASVTAISNVNWLGVNASVLGPAVSERYEDQEVWQECPEDMEANNEASWPFDYMATYRLASYQKIISVESAATFEVHIWGDENDDLDLGIFYDHNLNGEIDKEDVIDKSFCEFEAYISWAPTPSWSPVAGCPDSDSDEAVKLIQPPDGQYIIAVYGWGVRSGAVEGAGVPALFDMEISMIVAGVEGFGLSGSHEDELDEASAYQSSVPSRPFEEQTFDISWSFPDSSKDGPYGGVLYLGPKQSPKLLPILINIILDRTEPVIVTTLPSENALISDTKPTLSANLEEANMDKIKLGSLDPNSPRMFLDGVEITSLCAVSVPLIPNNADAPVKGYVTGTITYVPAGHLSEGGHIVEVRSSDIAGNTVIKKWGFTIDSTLPLATLSTESDVTYTNINTATFKGTLEIGASLKVQGGDSVVKTYADGTFSAMVELSDGDNQLTFIATDSAGNNIEIRHMAIVDKVSPIFNRLVALDGSTTNKRMTGIYGEMTETGTMELNGMQLPVNSDGTFRYDAISLIEGENTQALKFTDRAGNVAYNFMNITLDTTAPILDLNAVESVVNEAWLNLTGTTDTDASSLTINGKLVDIDDNGNFQNTLRLSQGLNTIVVESKDRAGNSVQEVLTVNFNADAGWVNYGAIGLIVILFVLGLLIGLFLGGKLLGGPKEETDEVPEPTEESLDETLEGPLMEGEELEAESEISDMETPEDGLEPIPDEEAMSEETVPEDGLEPIPDEEAMSETVPEDGLEPIPAEESIPEEMPSETEAPESEEISPEPVPVDEDPRIAKLTDAYESGKISKELYEKNLARFKGQ